MSIELEAKVKVADLGAIRTRLAALDARCVERRFERNIYFDTPDHRLQAADEGLRVRSLWPLGESASVPTPASGEDDAGGTHVITFKGPQRGEGLKQREEIEFSVGSAAAATKLLARLGFVPSLGFEKRRECWRWAVDACQFDLDEVPLLGAFLEIEGPTAPAVHGALARLGLTDAPLITRSYIGLLADEAAKRGMRQPVVQFEVSDRHFMFPTPALYQRINPDPRGSILTRGDQSWSRR